MKALFWARGTPSRRGHGIAELVRQLPGGSTLIDAAEALALDVLYQPSRYPDALPGGVPGELFTATQAAQALERARRIVAACAEAVRALHPRGDPPVR